MQHRNYHQEETTVSRELTMDQKDENKVIRRAATDLVAAGYQLTVDNGAEEPGPWTSTVAEVMSRLRETDADRLMARRDGKTSWVLLVYGNDPCEVVADYTVDLEEVLAGANEVADRLDA